MIKYEDECCSCAVPGYPCLGSSCPNRNVSHYYCDRCHEEVDRDELYIDEYTGGELCLDCIYGTLKKAYD